MTQVAAAGVHADAAAAIQDVPNRNYAAAVAGGGPAARAEAASIPLKPCRIPEALRGAVGATVPFVPAKIAVLEPAVAEALLARSAAWAHLCTEEYADPMAAFVNERFSLRFVAARAGKISFCRAPGLKPIFLFEKIGEKTYTPFLTKTMTLMQLAGEEDEDAPEVVRFSAPEEQFMEMTEALQGVLHRRLSHAKDSVRVYEAIVSTSEMRKLAAVGLIEERRAVVSSRFKEFQVTVRPKRKHTPEQLFQLAKQFSTASGALLKQGCVRLRFATTQAMMEATKNLQKQEYNVIYDVPPKRKEDEAPTWVAGMELPEPSKQIWAIKSLNSRAPELFEEAAERLGLHIYKLPTFTLALVEAKKGGTPLHQIKLSELDSKFRGMTLDLLDRF